jgi:2-polyprenyl-3-methyl-5-hydroxy-6-metoxy-1,4-benzoquinol methylase
MKDLRKVGRSEEGSSSRFRLTLSESNPNTRANSEEAFRYNGPWEKRGGREQTRLFALSFHRHTKVPFTDAFSVLDVGCALGDSLPVWHKLYPRAELSGCDISRTAVDRASELHGSFAKFSRASFEDIKGFYDVIFCSNVLEHFEQHVEIARELLGHCKILFVMTPYAELDNGRPLTPSAGSYHVASFLEDTFSALEIDSQATVRTKVVRCAKAWGPTLAAETIWHVKYLMGIISSPSPPRRQIIYTITSGKWLQEFATLP